MERDRDRLKNQRRTRRARAAEARGKQRRGAAAEDLAGFEATRKKGVRS